MCINLEFSLTIQRTVHWWTSNSTDFLNDYSTLSSSRYMATKIWHLFSSHQYGVTEEFQLLMRNIFILFPISPAHGLKLFLLVYLSNESADHLHFQSGNRGAWTKVSNLSKIEHHFFGSGVNLMEINHKRQKNLVHISSVACRWPHCFNRVDDDFDWYATWVFVSLMHITDRNDCNHFREFLVTCILDYPRVVQDTESET